MGRAGGRIFFHDSMREASIRQARPAVPARRISSSARSHFRARRSASSGDCVRIYESVWDEHRQVLQTVLGQSQRLQRVVDALLFLARSEGEAELAGFEPIDLTIPRDSTSRKNSPLS